MRRGIAPRPCPQAGGRPKPDLRPLPYPWVDASFFDRQGIARPGRRRRPGPAACDTTPRNTEWHWWRALSPTRLERRGNSDGLSRTHAVGPWRRSRSPRLIGASCRSLLAGDAYRRLGRSAASVKPTPAARSTDTRALPVRAAPTETRRVRQCASRTPRSRVSLGSRLRRGSAAIPPVSPRP